MERATINKHTIRKRITIPNYTGTRRIGGAAFQYQRRPRARMPAAADGPMAPVDAAPGRGDRPCVDEVTAGDGGGGDVSSSPDVSRGPSGRPDIGHYVNEFNLRVHPKI